MSAAQKPGCGPERFTDFRGGGIADTLAQELVPVADELRDLRVQFGLRPYMVHVVRTRWSGGRRGVGQEVVVSDTAILPTPLISDLTGLGLTVTPAALDEVGQITLSEVSGAYTEDQLLGWSDAGERPGPDEQVFYEVEFLLPGGGPGERRRFSTRSAPYYQADRFQWVMTLARASDARSRTGELR
jgi:hypothetical protein